MICSICKQPLVEPFATIVDTQSNKSVAHPECLPGYVIRAFDHMRSRLDNQPPKWQPHQFVPSDKGYCQYRFSRDSGSIGRCMLSESDEIHVEPDWPDFIDPDAKMEEL